jgi:hypothetical protein
MTFQVIWTGRDRWLLRITTPYGPEIIEGKGRAALDYTIRGL